MSQNDLDDDDFSDVDDDLLLELNSRPPRNTQGFTQISTAAATQSHPILKGDSHSYQESPNAQNKMGGTQSQANISDDIVKKFETRYYRAQGEADMLRDKIKLITKDRSNEKQKLILERNLLNEEHNKEIEELKRQLQTLKDEKTFLLMDNKRKKFNDKSTHNNTEISETTNGIQYPEQKVSIQSIHTQIPTVTDSNKVPPKLHSPTLPIKKQKMKNIKKDFITLNLHRSIPDNNNILLETIIQHTVSGTDITVLEILDKITFGHIRSFQFNNLITIKMGDSIGRFYLDSILNLKNLPLNKFIDSLFENTASLIKKILFHKKESDLSIPFLLSILHQFTIFRPSAVFPVTLKQAFLFVCGIIKKKISIFWKPIKDKPLNDFDNLIPQIFQYELIDILIVSYSYDLLESILSVLQSHPSSTFNDFFDNSVLESLEMVYRLATGSKFKLKEEYDTFHNDTKRQVKLKDYDKTKTTSHPITNIVISTISILKTFSNILLTVKSEHSETPNYDLLDRLPPKWWRKCITMLYPYLTKRVRSFDIYNNSNLDNYLYISKYHDFDSLNRSIGANAVGLLIPNLIDKNRMQSDPQVVHKDEVIEAIQNPNQAVKTEMILIQLEDEVLNILNDVIELYPKNTSIDKGHMFTELVNVLANKQEIMIETYVGYDTQNNLIRSQIIEHLLVSIYQLWTFHEEEINFKHIEEVKISLVTILTRFLDNRHDTMNIDKNNTRDVIDQLEALNIHGQSYLFDDVFDNMPAFVKEEYAKSSYEQHLRMIQIDYGDTCKQIARTLLENRMVTEGIITVAELDDLYESMGK